jgi:hypothetical protein
MGLTTISVLTSALPVSKSRKIRPPLTISYRWRKFYIRKMELDGREQLAVKELGNAVNTAIEQSQVVADAIDHIRSMGFEPNLNLKLEIALEELAEALVKAPDQVDLDFTEDDLNTLRRMKIKVDD